VSLGVYVSAIQGPKSVIWETQPRGVEVLGSVLCPDGHLPEGRLGRINESATARQLGSLPRWPAMGKLAGSLSSARVSAGMSHERRSSALAATTRFCRKLSAYMVGDCGVVVS
jgi:hypothetical protein